MNIIWKCFHRYCCSQMPIDWGKIETSVQEWMIMLMATNTVEMMDADYWMASRIRSLQLARALEAMERCIVARKSLLMSIVLDDLLMEQLRNVPHMEWMLTFCGGLLDIGETTLTEHKATVLQDITAGNEMSTLKALDFLEEQCTFHESTKWMSVLFRELLECQQERQF